MALHSVPATRMAVPLWSTLQTSESPGGNSRALANTLTPSELHFCRPTAREPSCENFLQGVTEFYRSGGGEGEGASRKQRAGRRKQEGPGFRERKQRAESRKQVPARGGSPLPRGSCCFLLSALCSLLSAFCVLPTTSCPLLSPPASASAEPIRRSSSALQSGSRPPRFLPAVFRPDAPRGSMVALRSE